MNFERRPEYDDAMIRMQGRFASPEPGSVIFHAEIAETITADRKSAMGRRVFTRFRKWLESEQRLLLRPVPDVGYRVLTAAQAESEALPQRVREATRRGRVGLRESSTIDEGQLSTLARCRLHNRRQGLRDVIRKASSVLRITTTLTKIPEPEQRTPRRERTG